MRLCRLASRLLDVPAVLVALKDDGRSFLLGSIGLEQTFPDRWWGQTPLSLAISDQVSTDTEPLRIDDLGNRPLLAADPLHREHGFRGLLAVPLHPGPHNFGSICALSHAAREWTESDLAALREIAESVVSEIQLRGSVRQMRTVEEAAAEATRGSFLGLIDTIDAVVHERDLSEERFRFVGRRVEQMFGYPIERWMEEPDFWRDVILHPDDRAGALRCIEAAAHGEEIGTFEYRACTADSRTVWVRDSARLVRVNGEPRLLRGAMLDITPRKEAELELQRKNRLLELLRELTVLADEGDSEADTEKGLAQALHRLCTFVSWPVGHIWMRHNRAPTTMDSTGIWCLADPERYAAFRTVTEGRSIEFGKGLPGRVWKSGMPAWIPVLAEDNNFPRNAAASEVGLKAGFGFPILSAGDVLGVVELFTNVSLPPEPSLIELAGPVGALLGRVIERRAAEAARHAHEERLRAITETAHDPFVSLDEDSAIREWNPAATRVFGWTADEVAGRHIAEVIIPERFRAEHERGISHFLRTGEGPLLNRRVEVPALHKDGHEIPVELTISPVKVAGHWFFNAFLHDISERLREDEDRGRRENLLAETQRLARIGSWEWDIRADTISWSDELHRIFGTDPATFDPTFDAYLERLPDDDRELARSVIGNALEHPGAFEFEHRVVLPEQSERVIHSQGKVVVGADGKPARMLGTAQDVTERARARERERQLVREQSARVEAETTKERIRKVLASITDAFIAVDRNLDITFVNPAGERFLAGSAPAYVGRHLPDVIPAGAEAIEGAALRALQTGEPTEVEAHLDDRDCWYEIRVFPSDEGLSLYAHDATDRRYAQELIRRSETRYRFLADSIPQQIWTARPDGKIEYVNQVVLDYTGRTTEEMVGADWQVVLHPDDADAAMQRWATSVKQLEPFEVEARLRNAEGDYRWHLCRARCETDPEGSVLRWYGSNTDIHDQKELEAARDQAVDDLERVTHLLSSERTNLEMQARELRRFARALTKSNEDLDRFAYVASHDLKAPLRGIANLTQWLVEDLGPSLTDDTKQYATLLQNRVQRMEALIDGILQYSRAGRSREEPETLNVGELVDDAIELLAPPEHFTIRKTGFWPTIRTERTPLQQVFMNLIGNAIKHANGDNPVIEVRMRDEGEDFCEFSVTDNGPGIAPEYHDRIFTIFQTLKARDEVEGTGIGLSVVKRTVENQGGQVWVESDVGKGATFGFLWPRDPDAKEKSLG